MDMPADIVIHWADFFRQHGADLALGLWTTLHICAVAVSAGILLGFMVEILSRNHILRRRILRVYIEIFRGTPLLVQLYLLYFGGPAFGLSLEADTAGTVGLALYAGAYFAEIFRAGFLSIPAGHLEAAHSLGISPLRILWRIELPQMAGLIVPPSVNQIITLMKDSAVLSIITVTEMTKQSTRIMNESFIIVEPLCLLALSYWLLSSLAGWAGRCLEIRLTRHRSLKK
ncbi:MAG: amino acid ABC transporter permease [Desulfovibrio sp.]|jgi:polar amino acid transport system permease protein|nr:amino acid ABC transporter permease [Desulfovibrio sp.]